MKDEVTNWNYYYKREKSIFSILAQAIQRKYIISGFDRINQHGCFRVVELGGANSCLFETIYKIFMCREYKVIDISDIGLAKFKSLYKKNRDCTIRTEMRDLLKPSEIDEEFDLACSLGLIEHFDSEGTEKIIESHFRYTKSGGYVLITFPTPTLQYRCVRRAMELMHVWQFWDERPLLNVEVEPLFEQYGTVIYKKLMRGMPLTQMLYIIKKR